MKTVKINRYLTDPRYGTFGTVVVNEKPICLSLEEYKYGNKTNQSCIPSGEYICRRYSSKNHPHTYEVTKVPDRSKILFHVGNTIHDTEGCILLGTQIGVLNNKIGILQSRVAFNNFIAMIGNEDMFKLTIKESF